MQSIGIIRRRLFYVCVAILTTACSHVDEITPRSYVQLLVGDLRAQRLKIATALSKGEPVASAGPLALESGGGTRVVPFDFGRITAGGTIVVHSKKYGIIVIQEPTVAQGGVAWSCTVYPSESKPKLCDLESQTEFN